MDTDTKPSDTQLLDQQAQAIWARMWSSISPESRLLAWTDWISHLAISPGKRLELLRLAAVHNQLLQAYLRQYFSAHPDQAEQNAEGAGEQAPILPCSGDRRFQDPAWQQWPFNVWHQSFLMTQNWWEHAARNVWGVSPHHEAKVAFDIRQWLDVFSPSNWLLSNPVVLQRTQQELGANLLRGMQYFAEDVQKKITGQSPAGAENFVVGRDVGITPGKVVLRNPLMELIQYAPTTDKVHPEPILIVPAWIMKYYILDLSQHNSLIKYMVSQGHTVFCISWKNPGVDEAILCMDDYLALGVEAALDAINAIVPKQKVHAAGYCLGGTLLSIANAAMARDGQDRLASMTLFTAQTDFTEPGQLALFIDDSQLAMLEAQMRETGYLQAGQMVGAFQLLNSYDMLWSRMVSEYLLGERGKMIDLMAWNADATRMPALMHAQYLRRLFLNNDLAGGRYPVRGKPVVMADVRTPIFCVATYTDHVAPWRSVYKLHYMTPAELTFVLTKGGHNAGIVSEPGRKNRYYQILKREVGGQYLSHEDWLQQAPREEGSWWPTWSNWLKERSSGPAVTPPTLGSKDYPVLMDAPGEYVLEK